MVTGLALRFLADESEEDLLEHLQRRQAQVVWETNERLLVGVTAAPGTDAIVRRAARMAARIKAELKVLHVIADDGRARSEDQQLALLRQLSADVGAHWNEIHADDPAKAIIDYAREHQITQIVVGSSSRTRWEELKGGGSIIRRMSRLAGEAGIDVHIIARRDVTREPQLSAETSDGS